MCTAYAAIELSVIGHLWLIINYVKNALVRELSSLDLWYIIPRGLSINISI